MRFREALQGCHFGTRRTKDSRSYTARRATKPGGSQWTKDVGRTTPPSCAMVIAALEEELATLRRRLRESPGRIEDLENELSRTRERLDRATSQNDKLAAVLEEAREQLGVLREEVEKLTAPPNNFGTVLQVNDDGTIDILTGSRKLRVSAQPNVEVKKLQVGQEILLNEAFNIIDIRHFEPAGEVLRVREPMTDGRVVVLAHADEEKVLNRAETMADVKLRPGDYVRIDTKTGLILEKMERPEVEELVLEEVPDITYEDVGGLADQIEQIRDTVELPYLHRDLFREYQLEPPKGILLYGPPGCGKTLIAKAVANSLAKKVSERTGNPDVRSYFLNIKGPELLNKWVGETERQIRLIFQRAKEKSDEGVPVIVFFDEMDSLFRTRGTGISSDVESTIVPQLLSELDGVGVAEERRGDRGLEPRGPDRPRHPAPRSVGCEDQDQPTRPGRGTGDLPHLSQRSDPARRGGPGIGRR